MPVRPVASVEMRSSMRARTTSRSTSGPEPAACERTSERCSWWRIVDRDVPGGQGAEAGRDAVVRLGVVREPADHLAGAPHLGQGLLGQARPARRRGRRARRRRWSAGRCRRVTGSSPGRASALGAAGPAASVYTAGSPGRGAGREWALRCMSSIGAPATPPCTGAGLPYRLRGETVRRRRCDGGLGGGDQGRVPATGGHELVVRARLDEPAAGRAPRSGRRRGRSTAGGRS